jgi:hypothetical protein
LPKMTTKFFLLLLVVAIALNLVATVCVMRSDIYSASQKTLQAMLAWLLPLIGAILVLSVWAHNRKSASRDPVRHGEGPWLPGIGPESDNVHHGGSFGGSSHEGHAGDGGGSDG